MMTIRQVLRGLDEERRGIAGAASRIPATTWAGYWAAFGLFACIGLLPLGAWSLALQGFGVLFLGVHLVMPGGVAWEQRRDDTLQMRDRDSAVVTAHLPDLIAVSAFPFYMLAQTILFWRVMQYVPGALEGQGWIDAWRHSINNLLLTEIFFDLFDVFRLTVAPDPPGLVGQWTVFLTRAILSLGFVTVVVRLCRAVRYRAAGLGRGVDLLGALHGAVQRGDAVAAGHLGREIAQDVHGRSRC